MKNFKILPYLLVLFCSMFSILACNKESLSLIDSYTSADSVEESAIKDIFYKRKESAKILSIILQDNSITQKIAQECQKRLCQETEILFADVLKIKNAEGLTLQEVFKTKYSYAADELLKNDPLLCIYHYLS